MMDGLREQVSRLEESNRQVLQEFQDFKAESAKRSATQMRHIALKAERRAHLWTGVLRSFLLVLLLVASAYTLPFGLPPIRDAWAQYLLNALFIVLLLLGLLNLWKGVMLEPYFRRVEVKFAKQIEARIRSSTGLDEDGPSEPLLDHTGGG
jgi:hypothetical protein